MLGEEARQNARKCISRAQAYLRDGDLASARRMAEKSKRFHPLAEVEPLLAVIARKEKGNSSSRPSSRASPSPSQPRPRTERKRAPEGDQRKYTPQQEKVVRTVRSTKDYYKLLRIERTASSETITKAFRKLAVQCHPDKNPHPGAEDAFKKLNTIKGVLTDSQKRRTYDRFGEQGVNMEMGGGGRETGSRTGGFTEEDLFHMFFEGRMPRRSGRRAYHQRHGRRGGNGDANIRVQPQYLQLLQILPLLVLFLFSALSGPSADETPFSLAKSESFPVPRTTMTGTPYYVGYRFHSRYGHDSRALYTVESMVDEDYFSQTNDACFRERKEKKKAISRAERLSSDVDSREYTEQLANAHAMQTPNCDKIDALLDVRA
eukprot:jgi/Bigna1/66522/fgenesh1_pg.1_\